MLSNTFVSRPSCHPSREFSCGGDPTNSVPCVPRGFLCDGVRDCANAADEAEETCRDFVHGSTSKRRRRKRRRRRDVIPQSRRNK